MNHDLSLITNASSCYLSNNRLLGHAVHIWAHPQN